MRCDSWFAMETRELPSAVLRILAAESPEPTPDTDFDRLTAVYRDLRREIVGHGREMNSVDGTLEAFRRLGITVAPDRITAIVESLFTRLVAQSALVEGVVDLVWQLRRAGFTLGIVSNAVHHAFLIDTLRRHSILAAFDVVVTSASSGFYKSNSHIFRDTIRQLGADPGASVHIGDSYRWDHLASRSIGMASVWFNESGELITIEGPLPDLEIRHFPGSADSIMRLATRQPFQPQ